MYPSASATRFPHEEALQCISSAFYLKCADTYSVTVRDCTVDNGDTTSDTEMGRESHCWMVNMVRFNDVDMHGCALACHSDGCNHGVPTHHSRRSVSLAALAAAMAALMTLVAIAHSGDK